jgi:uncharacterized protein HemX
VSPLKTVMGKRGTKALLIVWATLIVLALLAAGYVLGSAPGQIQSQRAEATLINCQEQNARHDAAIHQLDALIAAAPANRRRTRSAKSAGDGAAHQRARPET